MTPGSFSRRVAVEVRAQMARQGTTGQELAGALEVSRTWLTRRLQGDTPFDVNDLDRIARLLDVPLAELLRHPLAASEAGADAPAPPAPRRRRSYGRRLAAVTQGDDSAAMVTQSANAGKSS